MHCCMAFILINVGINQHDAQESEGAVSIDVVNIAMHKEVK